MSAGSYIANQKRQKNFRLAYALKHRVYFPGTIDQVLSICDVERAKPDNPDIILVYEQVEDYNSRVLAEMRRVGLEIEPTRGGHPPQPRTRH